MPRHPSSRNERIIDTMDFPEGFLWGASTAAHQIEGGNVNSDWWQREWGHLPGPPVEAPSGDAADSYHRYPEDMALLADAGLDAYRFSIEWARIEPEKGWVSRAAIDHYRRMVGDGSRPRPRAGDHAPPLHQSGLVRPGGRMARRMPRSTRSARYVEAALPVLEDVELRLHDQRAEHGVGAGRPGGGLPVDRSAARRAGRDGPADRRAPAARSSSCAVGGCAGGLVGRDAGLPAGARRRAGRRGLRPRRARTSSSTPRRATTGSACRRTRARSIGPDGPLPIADDAERTLTGWEYFPPAVGDGIRNALGPREARRCYVTENGIATADDARRIDYTTGRARGACADCIDEGIDVRGYLHWSALDNYEWGSFRPTFGLIGWDRETFERHPKPSLAWLGGASRAPPPTRDRARRGGVRELRSARARCRPRSAGAGSRARTPRTAAPCRRTRRAATAAGCRP